MLIINLNIDYCTNFIITFNNFLYLYRLGLVDSTPLYNAHCCELYTKFSSEMLGGAVKRLLSSKTKSEYDVSDVPWTTCLPPVQLGPLEKDNMQAKSTNSLERGLLSPSSMSKFSDDQLYHTGSPKRHSRPLSLPDAANLKGLTDDLDTAMAEMLKISGKGKQT